VIVLPTHDQRSEARSPVLPSTSNRHKVTTELLMRIMMRIMQEACMMEEALVLGRGRMMRLGGEFLLVKREWA
jgi:hypothetical protein